MFSDLDILAYGEDRTNSLLKAKKQFEYLIQPAERRVAIKLKKQLSSVNANTRQVQNNPFAALQVTNIC